MFPSRIIAVGLLRRAAAKNVAAAAVPVTRTRRFGDDNGKFVKTDSKYKLFRDDDSSVVLDVEEERALLDSQLDRERSEYDEVDDFFAGFDTTRECNAFKRRRWLRFGFAFTVS